jgi:hypothetical protein
MSRLVGVVVAHTMTMGVGVAHKLKLVGEHIREKTTS